MKSPIAAICATFSTCAFSAALLCAAQPAAAAVITSLPDGEAQAILARATPGVSVPVQFGDGVTYDAKMADGSRPPSLFGQTATTNFSNSVVWSGVPMVTFGARPATMSFTFDDPVSAALGEFNWTRLASSTTIFRIYDSEGALLESLSFKANDPAHLAGFYGFQRSTNEISRFEIEGYWVGARNLSVAREVITSGVPEPTSWALMIVGFGAAGAMVRTQRRREIALVA
ncbi:MAG TPA: PEPxxWA-CTERM sorting domain-containing protein [Phenylobacterium sp.]|jgi:hypothetical protein|nr:PEPxxWA-CTERM sorting domain-containing protein [Phenylobacterium sp.]